MKVKVSEATKNQLNWMVSLATGVPVTLSRGVLFWTGTNHVADPITDWSRGGPIIEWETIDYAHEAAREAFTDEEIEMFNEEAKEFNGWPD